MRIEQLTESVGASGFPVESWAWLADVWARKDDLSAREQFAIAAGQVSAPYDTRWTIAFMDAMNPEKVNVPKTRRLVVNGRVHDIVAATEVGRREGIELQTLSGARST